MKTSRIKLIFLLLVSILIFVSACGTATENVDEAATTSQPPKPTLTATTMPIADASSWTPLPTLASDDSDMVFKSWFKGTPVCSLPCWAGIVPGETNWAEAVHTLAPVLDLHIAENQGNCRFGPCKYLAWQYELEGNLYDGNLYSKDSIVYAVFLEGEYSLEYAMREVFVKYGEPTQAFVHTSPYTYAGEPPQLDFVALYAKNKFVVRYIWQAQVQDQTIVACDEPSVFMLGVVAIDESKWTGLEIDQAGNQLDNSAVGDGRLRPIAEVLDMNVDGFYQKVLEGDPSLCITTPVKYWE